MEIKTEFIYEIYKGWSKFFWTNFYFIYKFEKMILKIKIHINLLEIYSLFIDALFPSSNQLLKNS